MKYIKPQNLYIISVFLFICSGVYAFMTSPRRANEDIGDVFIMPALSLLFLLAGLYIAYKRGAAAGRAMLVADKALYDLALQKLSQNPDSQELKIDALEKGRKYYRLLHPNTSEILPNGLLGNFRDNSGIVEQKVQSDILVRTKMKG